jgi:hypothetical protein
MSTRVNVEDGRIGFGFSESNVSESAANNFIPFAPSLFKLVNWLVKLYTIFLWVSFLISWQLLHKDFFI